MIDKLGYIPGREEHPTVITGNISLTVQNMVERHIDKIKVERVTAEKNL